MQLERMPGAQLQSSVRAQHRQAAFEASVIVSVMLIVVVAAVLGALDKLKECHSRYLPPGTDQPRPQRRGSDRSRASPERSVCRKLNSPDYLRAQAPLLRIRRAVPDIHYIYTIVLEGNDIRFVLDAADPAAKNISGYFRPGRSRGALHP